VTGPAARPAGPGDIPELVRLRALLFASLADGGWGPAPAGGQWRDACATALATALADEATRVIVTDSPSGLACCAIATIDRRLPSPYNPGGRIGHVYGVVTDPAHRGRGHARTAMRALLGWLGEQGITRADLNASPDGQRLYRDLGFTDHPDPVLSWRTKPR
jgi:ribosomal protein S18 acetylase RimI-like enzyme